MKKVLLAMTAITAMAFVAIPLIARAQVVEHHPTTICHRTNSVTNPYVKITVDDDSVDANPTNQNGPNHFGEHLGPIFDPANPPPPPHNGDQWGDIIPPTANDGFPLGHAGLNWPAGADILANGCNFPDEVPENPSASLSTPTCPNPNIVATGVNPTDDPITFDVFVNGVLVDSFIVQAGETSTSASIPVKDNDVVTVTVQGSQTVLDTETVNLECETTTPPPVVTTPPPVVTTPPPVVTTPPPVVTTPPPVVTTPPPPVGGPGPGPGNPPSNPPVAAPPKLAFTGPEAALPIGALATALAGAGTGLLMWGRKRRKNDEYQAEHFPEPPN